MQLHKAVCFWFPWWISKINIKVCDRRVAYWFKRSRSCSHNVSTFDLWPIFMFFDNTADCGCDCGWTEETVGLPPSLTDCPVILPPPQFTVSHYLRPHRHETQSQRALTVMTYEFFCTWGGDFGRCLKVHSPGWKIYSCMFTAQLLLHLADSVLHKKVQTCLVKMV